MRRQGARSGGSLGSSRQATPEQSAVEPGPSHEQWTTGNGPAVTTADASGTSETNNRKIGTTNSGVQRPYNPDPNWAKEW